MSACLKAAFWVFVDSAKCVLPTIKANQFVTKKTVRAICSIEVCFSGNICGQLVIYTRPFDFCIMNLSQVVYARISMSHLMCRDKAWNHCCGQK